MRYEALTKVLVRLTLLIFTWALMSSTSNAIDNTYVGTWSRNAACEIDEAFQITQQGMSGHEFICTTTRSLREKGGWNLRLSCSAEGESYTLNVRWRLLKSGNLRQTIKGKTVEFLRCSSKKAPQSEVSKMNTPFGRVTPDEFAQKCVECMNESQELGRSVGGYCPPDCVDVFSNNMICDNQGKCRVGSPE
jgi:hypothetical protein